MMQPKPVVAMWGTMTGMRATPLHRLGLAPLLVLICGTAAADPLPLERGVGLHEWLNWSPLAEDGSYRRPPYTDVTGWLTQYRPLSDWPPGNELERIRDYGFDFVRLTVDPGPLLGSEGAERQQALAVLDEAVRQITAAGLNVVFNFHPNSQVRAFSPQGIEGPVDAPSIGAYRRMVVETAQMLVRVGIDRVAIEPFNEPAYYPCDASGGEDWQQVLTAQINAIRAVSEDITIIATGACGGSVTGLIDVDPTPFDDPAVLYSFHMYEPHSFTHQREEGLWHAGLPWPADRGSPGAVVDFLRSAMVAKGVGPAEQDAMLRSFGGALEDYFAEGWSEAQLQARFDAALGWATEHGIASERLFMGEFGVIALTEDGSAGAFDADRYRYLEAARVQAEKHGIAWSLWEYSNPYGMSFIVPAGQAVPDAGLVKALGLPPALRQEPAHQ